MANAQFKVINQKKEIIPNASILIEYDNEERIENTGQDGVLVLYNLEVSEQISFSLAEYREVSISYEIEKSENSFILEVRALLIKIKKHLFFYKNIFL